MEEVLKLFDEWLQNELKSRNLSNKNVAFITWSDWEFDIVLDLECKRKSLKKPDYFNKWVDLRADFTKKYKKFEISSNTTFVDALMRMGIYSGGNKSKNAQTLAALAYKMVADGTTLTITDK